jgi:uncharacterized protein (TIGR02444 family)
MNPPGTEAFWRFTLETYARPDVSALCIALQDRDGRDVNLLLLALFCGQVLGRRLGSAEFAALEAGSAAWRDGVSAPLRQARRALKAWGADPEAAALRRTVQAAEIEGERLGQRFLLDLLPPGEAAAPGPDLARANLEAYAGPDTAALATAALD